MKKIASILLLIACPLLGSPSEESIKQAKQFGKSLNKDAFNVAESFDINLIKPKNAPHFDPEKAREQLLHETYTQKVPDFITQTRGDLIENDFIEKAERIAKQSDSYPTNIETEEGYTFEICLEEDAPYLVNTIRSLDVELIHHPEKAKAVNVCSGHDKKKSYFWKKEAEKKEKKLRKELSSDPSVKQFYVEVSGGGIISEYEVIARWKHKDNSSKCDNYQTSCKVQEQEYWEERETWKVDAQHTEIDNSQHCTFMTKECLDSGSRIINGKEIYKKCWKEQASYICRYPHQRQCDFLKKRNCVHIKKICKKEGVNGCALWEHTYKCVSKLKNKHINNDDRKIVGEDQNLWETEYSPNSSFSDVTTALMLFEEIKKELLETNAFDATKIHLFEGKKMKCAKNVADKLIYDCCFSYGGLANDVKLSKCDSEEIALGEMRDKGLCHYIGAYDEHFLEMWKSSKKHVYCCFPSKLSRVFQEEAKGQLGISWGTAEKPLCRGLTHEEINQVDFSRIDLSEAFVEVKPLDMECRIDRLRQNLKKKIEEASSHEIL